MNNKIIFALLILVIIVSISIIIASDKINKTENPNILQQPVMTDESMPGMKH